MKPFYPQSIRSEYYNNVAWEKLKRITFLAKQIETQTKCTWGEAIRAAEELIRKDDGGTL